MTLLTFLIFFVAFSFIFYGKSCLHTTKMKLEFKRYKLEKYRILTGSLQLIGGFGLLLGYYFSNLLLILSSGGLCLLMIAGFSVRLKIKDGFVESAPSFIYALLSLYICYKSIVMP